MTKNKINLKKIILIMLIVLAYLCAVTILGKTVDGSVITKKVVPTLDSSPIYVNLADGENIKREFKPVDNMRINGIEILLVDVVTNSDLAEIDISIIDKREDDTVNTQIDVGELAIGEWSSSSFDYTFYPDHEYDLDITAKGCDVSFMQVNGYDFDISLGFDVVTNDHVTLGDIFYYSRVIALLLAASGILLVLFDVTESVRHLLPLIFQDG